MTVTDRQWRVCGNVHAVLSQIVVSEKGPRLKKFDLFIFVIFDKSNYELTLYPMFFWILNPQKDFERKFCEGFTTWIK
jgi:hypothetical protein